MSEQLGINPEMDELARDNGLGHWCCTDPINGKSWLRSDGKIRFHGGNNDWKIAALRGFDASNPIGKDWQQPRKDLISDLNKPTRTKEINGVTLEYDLFGGVDIKIEDFVYVHINYDHRYTHNATRKALTESIAGLIAGK